MSRQVKWTEKIAAYRNNGFRKLLWAPRMKRRLKHTDFTLLSNNCFAGLFLHDLGLRFDTPTVNLFFRETDFFDFLEHLDHYLAQPLKEISNTVPELAALNYPVAKLSGGDVGKDIEIHFMHYGSFEEAEAAWEKRKLRMHPDHLFAVWNHFESEDAAMYARAQALPVKHKMIIVNHPVDTRKYPDFRYVKGIKGTAGFFAYKGFFGRRPYDRIDLVGWINQGMEEE